MLSKGQSQYMNSEFSNELYPTDFTSKNNSNKSYSVLLSHPQIEIFSLYNLHGILTVKFGHDVLNFAHVKISCHILKAQYAFILAKAT